MTIGVRVILNMTFGTVLTRIDYTPLYVNYNFISENIQFLVNLHVKTVRSRINIPVWLENYWNFKVFLLTYFMTVLKYFFFRLNSPCIRFSGKVKVKGFEIIVIYDKAHNFFYNGDIKQMMITSSLFTKNTVSTMFVD